MNSFDEIFLDEKASLFLSAFETTTQPMAICDQITNEFLFVNQSFLDFFSYEVKDVVGKTYADLNIFNRKTDIDRINEELEERGYIHDFPIILNTHRFELKYAMLSVNIFEVKGRKLRYTIIEDKTDLYLTQSEINKIEQIHKEDNERYHALIESTRGLIWIVDPINYGLLMYNGPFINYMKSKKITPELGMTPNELLKPLNVTYWISLYERVKKEGRFSLDYLTETGDKYLYLTISPLKVGNQLIGISVFAEDVTEQTLYKIALEESNKKLSNMFYQSIQAISKLCELKDPYTAGRQKRVQELSVAIATDMGLGSEEIENLSLGSLVHDIGKIFIADEILAATDSLSKEDKQILREHPKKAYDFISEIELPKVIPTMILQHHERLDGSGYPLGLKSDEIILEARIIAVADLVEAMNYNRAYRPAPGIKAALEEIQKYKGQKYDSNVVETCLRLFNNKNFKFSK